MWPTIGEALSRTLADEACIENLTAEALRQWLPQVTGGVVPNALIAAAADTPPEPQPAQVAAYQSQWETAAVEVVLAGMAALWAINVVEALAGLGLAPLVAPSLPNLGQRDPGALSVVAGSLGKTKREVIDADDLIISTPALASARDDFIAKRKPAVFAVPAHVERKVEMATAEVIPLASGEHESLPTPAEQTTVLRTAAKEALDPAGPDMRQVARDQGYQAAGVQNHAVVTAAGRSEDSDELEKTWIATIDGKTRPTHFAADGQRTPLAGTFTIGGELLAYPADPAGSAAETANCRCRVGILAKDEKLPGEVDRHTERLNGRDSVQVNRQGSQRDEINRRAEKGNVRARDTNDGLGRTAAGGWSAPSETEYTMPPIVIGQTYRTFTNAVLAVIGEPTSDGRILVDGIDLSVRELPLPLQWCEQVEGGHLSSYTVGVIESASMQGGRVTGSGYILNTDEADQAAELIQHKVSGPSVDLAGAEWKYVDAQGNEITDLYDAMESDTEIFMAITKAELIGTTLVAMPAFGTTSITLNADREERDVGLVASAAAEFRPREYDPRLFADPQLSGPTLPTMGEDGRIYGHLAVWNQCHRSIQSECVLVPHSPSEYSHFHTSPALRMTDGSKLPVGRLTVGTGHADPRMGARPAAAHYDNTGSCFALVRVGEDSHGVWFSGVAHPLASAEQIEAGITAPLSGDWRNMGSGLDLIAALAVNTPGFAARGRDDDQGAPAALVASVGPSRHTQSGGIEHLSREDIRNIMVEAIEETRRNALASDETAALLARADQAVGAPPEPPTPTEEAIAMLEAAGL